MKSPRDYWPQWVETLRRYQLGGLMVWFLEAGQPLTLLFAQVLYMGRPFFGEGMDAFARTLESDDDAHAFASLLNGVIDP